MQSLINLHGTTSSRSYYKRNYRAMSVLLDVADNNEFWSQTNFTQSPDFPLDTECIGPQFIEPHIDDFVEIAEWDVEDTAASENSPGTSPVYNGPRLLPKIREQDRFLAPDLVL